MDKPAQHGRICSHPSGTPDHSGGSYVPAALGGCGGCGLLPAPLLSPPAASPLLPLPAPAAASAAACSFSCCCWAASTACWMALSRCPGVTVTAATAAAAAARLFAAAAQAPGSGRAGVTFCPDRPPPSETRKRGMTALTWVSLWRWQHADGSLAGETSGAVPAQTAWVPVCDPGHVSCNAVCQTT